MEQSGEGQGQGEVGKDSSRPNLLLELLFAAIGIAAFVFLYLGFTSSGPQSDHYVFTALALGLMEAVYRIWTSVRRKGD